MITSRGNWSNLLFRLEVSDNSETHAQLTAAYGAGARHYHNLDHIADCLEQLAQHHALAQHPDELALALWFHDAIYDWRSTANEAESAEWARRFVMTGSADVALADRIAALVMATQHGANDHGLSGDAALIVDIDLSILGCETTVYDRFESNIRKEYRWVPAPLYRRKRAEVLRGFLERPCIYETDKFEALYGARARVNLERAIKALM